MRADYLLNSEEDVRHNFENYNVFDDRAIFHEGIFNKPQVLSKHKDCSASYQRQLLWFLSRCAVLQIMYEMVPVGGIVIFDGIISHHAGQRCWKDFKREQGLPEELTEINRHCAWFEKKKKNYSGRTLVRQKLGGPF